MKLAPLLIALALASCSSASPENEDGQGNSPTFGGYLDDCIQTSGCDIGLICAGGGICPGAGPCCRLAIGGMLVELDAGSP